MGQKSVKGSTELARAIKLRRNELGLTIEEAAARAGVGTKTWSRYEAGESIRKDKCRGICKALNWHALPDENDSDDSAFDIHEYRNHEAWSEYLAEAFGEYAAVSFVAGSDILLDYIREDMEELSTMARGTHVGQIDLSLMKALLPKQFLMRYDYDFLYVLLATTLQMRAVAHSGRQIVANSVMEELVLYISVELSEVFMESTGLELDDMAEEWVYEVFGDLDIYTCLYTETYLPSDHSYHYNHWMQSQF